MLKRDDMKELVIKAIRAAGGKSWPKDVAKFIWDGYEKELKASGDFLYTWQYDVRWAAQALRNEGVLKPVNGRRDLPWELV